MSVFWIAGEPSGDVQAAAVADYISTHHPEIKQWGWGGQFLEKAGVTLLKDVTKKPFMGFIEVVVRARSIFKSFAAVKKQILSTGATTVVLVDYPGFNLRMAKWAKAQGLRVVYYIPPKVWAWKSGRAQILKKECDAILGILPFEQKWYADRNIDYTYVGNPLAQHYAGVNAYLPEGSIALLPGSRSQEIGRLLPEFIAVAQAMPKQSFVLIRPESAVPVWPNLETPENIKVFTGELKDGMKHCSAALVCSGTATLEVALMGVPQLVVYRANPVSLAIAKRFVKIRYISLPNLILDTGALPELLQVDARAEALIVRLVELLADPSSQLDAYTKLLHVLEQKDPAATAAEHILTISSDA